MSLLAAWYGDDFSGSTDVMEALERNGIPAVLFLKTPDADALDRFPEVRAAGIAGVSRSQSPQWMEENLPPVFERLRGFGARICSYKVCSTFDSSPQTGSIGRALEIGQRVFGSPWVPLVVGAPILKRYTIFGNLFATVNGETFRIDRHPTMSRHPVTPMHESDLRLHLGQQTSKRIDLVDILALQNGTADSRLRDALAGGAEVVLFDILDEASLREAGRLIWQSAAGTFAVGSSGLQYALAAHWKASGDVETPAPSFSYTAADRLLVVSGSCSPVTESQIRWALNNGFAGVALHAMALVNGDEVRVHAAEAQAEAALRDGRSAVVYTAMGPAGDMMASLGQDEGARDRIGAGLGRIAKRLIGCAGITRLMVAGGDTSGHAASQLSMDAIRIVRPLAPGSPLCRVVAGETEGLEVVFKGGQVGGDDYFGQALGAGAANGTAR